MPYPWINGQTVTAKDLNLAIANNIAANQSGNHLYTTSGPPASTLGQSNDFALDETTGIMYYNVNGVWQQETQLISPNSPPATYPSNIPESAGTPSPITTLTVSYTTSNSIAISWTPPIRGDLPFTYSIQYRVSGTSAWLLTGSISTTTYIISNLLLNVGYDVQVITSNALGSSGSNIVSTITGVISALPGTVVLTVTNVTSNSVSLNWTTPTTGAGSFTYQVQYRAANATAWQNYGPIINTLTSVVNGLVSNTQYSFRILVTNALGSNYSNTVTNSVTTGTTIAPPGALLIATGIPGSTSIPIVWTQPIAGTPPFQYQVQYSPATQPFSWINFGGLITVNNEVVTNLSLNTEYAFRVIAYNSGGNFISTVVESTTGSALVAPGEVGSFYVALSPQITSSSVSLAWSLPIAGTAPFTYLVQYRLSGNTNWLTATSTSTLAYTVNNLSPYTSYDFSLIAQNSAGESFAPILTTYTLQIVPGVISNLVAGTITSSSVSLSWVAPTVGTPPFSYIISYLVNGVTTTATSNTPNVTINNLTTKTQYSFKVTAQNNAGSGSASAPLTVTTN